MDIDYRDVIRSIRVSKRMGQTFLVNKDIAKTEANFGIGKKVIEMGPGLGILTRELCKTAAEVIAIEKDGTIYSILKQSLRSKKLHLINEDFFDTKKSELKGYDIMISNVPYVLSSKVISWISDSGIPAVLCLQREFINHMLAKPGEDNYTKLSVMSTLMFSITYVLDVSAGNFYPVPRVNSGIIYMRPVKTKIDKQTKEVISLIMNHKKKKLRNALQDSIEGLGLEKGALAEVISGLPNADERPFQISPEKILEASKYVAEFIGSHKRAPGPLS